MKNDMDSFLTYMLLISVAIIAGLYHGTDEFFNSKEKYADTK
jgi:hypothetical protein